MPVVHATRTREISPSSIVMVIPEREHPRAKSTRGLSRTLAPTHRPHASCLMPCLTPWSSPSVCVRQAPYVQ
eukprot:2417790-Prymnesium_polylepis.1